MKQIKTIEEEKANRFDEAVNQALSEGWELVRRYRQDGEYIAELEKEEIAEDERCCANCKHCDLEDWQKPCRDCMDASGWEEAE